jgi:hypothetical protein
MDTKMLQPLAHAVVDYAFAAKMIAAPWLFGFSDNKIATLSSVSSGAAIAGLSLMTDYPLGIKKMISFPTHGVIEAVSGVATALSPWLCGFSKNKRATWTHVLAGMTTLAVVAVTDYKAVENRKLQIAIAGRAGNRNRSRVKESDKVA